MTKKRKKVNKKITCGSRGEAIIPWFWSFKHDPVRLSWTVASLAKQSETQSVKLNIQNYCFRVSTRMFANIFRRVPNENFSYATQQTFRSHFWRLSIRLWPRRQIFLVCFAHSDEFRFDRSEMCQAMEILAMQTRKLSSKLNLWIQTSMNILSTTHAESRVFFFCSLRFEMSGRRENEPRSVSVCAESSESHWRWIMIIMRRTE